MTTATQKTTYESNPATGTVAPFASISEPGCYLCNWSGHLLRVPEDGVAPGRSPLINMVGNETLFVTKLSDNPFVPITKARMLASDLDCSVSF
jgi:hypothetical protein